METITVNLGDRSYSVITGEGAVDQTAARLKNLRIGSDAYIITNAVVEKLYGKRLRSILKRAGFGVRVKVVPDSERSKSMKTAFDVIRDLASSDINKRTFVIAFGGGVIGDCAGFVAAVYKRGIPLVHIPTTLLAQVDSSVGGKTAIDLPEGKNLVGAFYQPRIVISDIAFLPSLPLRQVRAGCAEIIKYAAISDAGLFSFLEQNAAAILSADREALVHVVNRCIRIKAKIVEKDEREEKGLRTILNFGHTVGHAIETVTKYTVYTHGEAIAFGMLAAAEISVASGMLDKGDCARLRSLIADFALPVRAKNLDLDKLIAAQYRDKKFSGSRNRFVVLKAIGTAVVTEDVPLQILRKALRTIL
jgi:3-dehydroquinate synthase